MVATVPKAIIWLHRFLQLAFAVILLGITSWLVHQFRDHTYYRPPREVVVPLIFSVLAVIFTAFSITGLFFLNHNLQLASAFLDFILFVGYITSAGLLRRNYHVRSARNDLRNKLISGRLEYGESSHRARIDGIVKLLSALVVIQLILFFITMLVQMWAAKRYRDENQHRTRGVGSKHSRHSRSSVRSNGDGTAIPTTLNSDPYAAPGATHQV